MQQKRTLCPVPDRGTAFVHACAGCLSKASTTVGGACQDFVALQSSLPPGNATDAQLQAVLAKNDKPSPR